MFMFRVIIYIFIIFFIFLDAGLSYDLWNGGEPNELVKSEEDFNNQVNREKDNVLTTYLNKLWPEQSSDTSDRIEFLISSIRESSADILQDVGDLEDLLLEGNLSKNSKSQEKPQGPQRNNTGMSSTDSCDSGPKTATGKPSSTTNKYVLNDMTIPCKNPNKTDTGGDLMQDILEEGKKKIKVWEQQIKICKNILENSNVPNKDSKNNSTKSSNKKKTGTTKKVNNNERKERGKLRRKRRRFLREGMENFRQVYS